MKKLISIFFIFLLGTGAGNVQSRTFTGDIWNTIPLEEKIRYVEGIYDGMGLMTGPWGVKSGNYLITELTQDELIDRLDRFYADSQNINIPVTDAISLLAKEMKSKNIMPELKKLREQYRK
ncbi:MAG: hypothetical protein JXD21_04000 [Candidatus Omnitrophica bacterium]|nr:hypothetical protein [Candidatus Omnitrophota bacterium]